MTRIRKRYRIGWFVRACKRVDGDGVELENERNDGEVFWLIYQNNTCIQIFIQHLQYTNLCSSTTKTIYYN